MKKEPKGVQREICENDGKFVVRACPGSGKTFTVAAKLAKLMENWPCNYQGIAVLSFTNIAWEEIERDLEKIFMINTPIKHPHFLGTIDSFINRFIFFPHSHLVLNSDSPPVLVGEPVSRWRYKSYSHDYNQYFDKISYDHNDNIIELGNPEFFFGKLKQFKLDGSENGHFTRIDEMKKRFLKRGFVNQSDIDYFSLKILEECPFIAKSIALRFPYIIIDEAQDTSEIQMKIVDILGNELKNLILVGDPDQAIFEWHNAKPELLNDKIKEWGNHHVMDENWRSSQNICDVTYHLSGLEKESTAVNHNVKDWTHNPKVWGYTSSKDYKNLIEEFLSLCKGQNIFEPSKIAILARSNRMINDINLSINENDFSYEIGEFWKSTNFARELIRSKYLHDNHDFQEAFKLIEKNYLGIFRGEKIHSHTKLSEIIMEKGYFNFKKGIWDFINLMPTTNDKSVGKWIDEFKVNLKNSNLKFNRNLYNNLEIEGRSDATFEDLFPNEKDDNYCLRTIHKVKGQTYEAVMLFLKKKVKKNYSTLLSEKTEYKDEELRNVYVGMTRPQKILILAVPQADTEIWRDYFKLGSQKDLFSFY